MEMQERDDLRACRLIGKELTDDLYFTDEETKTKKHRCVSPDPSRSEADMNSYRTNTAASGYHISGIQGLA